MTEIRVVTGDITQMEVDAIVNAANASLLGGGGVDGAIHSAAGEALLAECKLLGGAQTGEAKTTKGYLLPAKWVIHTVGPHWRGGAEGEAEQLASCYRNALVEAQHHRASSVAFPAISCGAYGYPVAEGLKIAVETVCEAVARMMYFEQILFVAHDDHVAELWREALARHTL